MKICSPLSFETILRSNTLAAISFLKRSSSKIVLPIFTLTQPFVFILSLNSFNFSCSLEERELRTLCVFKIESLLNRLPLKRRQSSSWPSESTKPIIFDREMKSSVSLIVILYVSLIYSAAVPCGNGVFDAVSANPIEAISILDGFESENISAACISAPRVFIPRTLTEPSFLSMSLRFSRISRSGSNSTRGFNRQIFATAVTSCSVNDVSLDSPSLVRRLAALAASSITGNSDAP